MNRRKQEKKIREEKKKGNKYVNPLFAVLDDIDKRLDEADKVGPIDKVTDKYGSYWPTVDDLQKEIQKARRSIDKDPSKATQRKLNAKANELLDKVKELYINHMD